MGKPIILVHALKLSRATRIIWLLELLQVPYEIKVYNRLAEFRAPDELKKIHPLGKSPLVEITAGDGSKQVLAESGFIIEYLIENYDKSNTLTASTKEDKNLVKYYLHYTEGSLQGNLTSLLVNVMAKKHSPAGVKMLVGAVTKKINEKFFKSETLKHLDYLESIARTNKGGYFVNNKLTGADIILSYPLVELVFLEGNDRDLFEENPKFLYPYLFKWSQLVANSELYRKATKLCESK